MKRLHHKLFLAAVVAALTTVPASAAVITSLPGGTVVPMPAANYFGPGPQAFGPGITWSSTNAGNQGGSVFGYTGGYGFGSNGLWTGGLGPMAGVNDYHAGYGVTDTMTFQFSTPVTAVGGIINYYPDGIDTPTRIAVYDSTNSLIESYTVSFSTGGGNDSGFFLGFSESTPISYFTLTDNYIGVTQLTIPGTATVPEPGSLLVLGLGLASVGAIGWMKRRRAKAATV